MSFILLFLSLFPRLNPLTTATLPEGSFIVVMRGILALALVVLLIFVENFWERVVLLLLAVDRFCALPLRGPYAQVSKASPFLMGGIWANCDDIFDSFEPLPLRKEAAGCLTPF